MAEGPAPEQPILGLGSRFYATVEPADFPQTILRFRHDRAAEEVGLASLTDDAWVQHFARFAPLPDNLPEPLALAYHGHQFRNYNPDIGDGRGFTFAQLRDGRGRLMDLGTKGSGRTPYSRTGDGRLTLKGAVREVLATEMLEALGVPTSRTLSIIETGEELERHDEPSPTRSAVLVRLSHGHIRFGSFQRLDYLGDQEAAAQLLDYVITQFYPEVEAGDAEGLLAAVAKRMAVMTARLMAAGFVHGVLNTDNMNITGECFDYGPWRFLPTLKPGAIAAYFDHGGLYAFGRQPEAIYWNLCALADALRPIADHKALQAKLDRFPDHYADAFADAILRRLGVAKRGGKADQDFAQAYFTFLYDSQIPFERAFFDLFGGRLGADKRKASPHADLYAGAAVVKELDQLEPERPERLDHAVLAEGPQTLLYEEVESLWDELEPHNRWDAFDAKISRIRRMGEAYSLSSAH
ncbi:MAG: YdiU family protein [Pseudomonadota bacterium]